MCIRDRSKANTPELTDRIVTDIVSDVKSSVPEKEGGQVLYPGEPELIAIRDNRENGIPVVEEKWNEVLAM